jgi:hypothetical protein
MNETLDEQEYYLTPGPTTDPGKYVDLFNGLPDDIPALCEIVQNNLFHIFWAERYGIKLSDEQQQTVNIRDLSHKLALIYEADPDPLVKTRELSLRQVGNCRDFSLLLTAFLRYKGIPTRARCGFGRYFLPGHFEDHWVCEYWNNQQSRWIMVDAQLDAFQLKSLGIRFNPVDVPHDQFITGGRAWQMCRVGQSQPDQFGIFDMHGWWFIWGDAVRDFYALNKIEILPWDGGWGYLDHLLDDPLPGEAELQQYDRIASLCANAETSFQEIRSVYLSDPKFRLPSEIDISQAEIQS